MVFESTEFSVLGIRLSSEDVSKFKVAFQGTYEELEGKDPRWKDVNFCKRQIGNLWDAVVDMLRKCSEEFTQEKRLTLDSQSIKTYLLIDTENEEFLTVLGKHSTKIIEEILARFKEELIVGSIRSRVYDTISGKWMHVKIDPYRIMQKIQKENERIRKMLQQFVEWAKGRGRPIITCMLVGGLFTLALVAGAYVGIAIPATKPFIMATIAIICWIAETVGMVSTVSALKDLWRWRGSGLEIELETTRLS